MLYFLAFMNRVTTARMASSISSQQSRLWPSNEACLAPMASPDQAACGWIYLSPRCCGLWQPCCAGLCLAYEAGGLLVDLVQLP